MRGRFFRAIFAKNITHCGRNSTLRLIQTEDLLVLISEIISYEEMFRKKLRSQLELATELHS